MARSYAYADDGAVRWTAFLGWHRECIHAGSASSSTLRFCERAMGCLRMYSVGIPGNLQLMPYTLSSRNISRLLMLANRRRQPRRCPQWRRRMHVQIPRRRVLTGIGRRCSFALSPLRVPKVDPNCMPPNRSTWYVCQFVPLSTTPNSFRRH